MVVAAARGTRESLRGGWALTGFTKLRLMLTVGPLGLSEMVIDPVRGTLVGCDDGKVKEGVEIEEVKARAISGNKK